MLVVEQDRRGADAGRWGVKVIGGIKSPDPAQSVLVKDSDPGLGAIHMVMVTLLLIPGM